MAGVSENSGSAKTGRWAVLEALKRDDSRSVDRIAEDLGLTGMAVRQHLAALKQDGLVISGAHFGGGGSRGRPREAWKVTAKADAHFADSHASLAADLIVQMKKAFGEDGLDTLLKLRNADLEKSYRARTDKAQTLKAKLDALAKIRSAEGYMAEVRREADTGHWLFVENHCPICAAARLCTGLCREELALFHRVLGKDIKVERLSHILAGAGRCAYRVMSI